MILQTLAATGTGEAAMETVLFYIFALLSGGSAMGVILSRNIVRAAVWLLFTLAGVAGLYFLLSAEFLAAVQLVIYAGGTLILIVFGVMLTSKSPFSRFEPTLGEMVTGITISIVMIGALLLAQQGTVFPTQPLVFQGGYPLRQLGQELLGAYLVPFELSSVLLLVVMIGAAYLAKGRRQIAPAGTATTALSQQARRFS